jgi:hypothetical protein
MPRGVRKHFKSPTPKLEDFRDGLKVPEIPKSFRQKLWNVIKIRTEIRLSEETEHFMNILCLHFGISRNDLILHAINLLWQEVVDSVGSERLKDYEDKLEAVRLYRLEKKESAVDRKKNFRLKFFQQSDRRGWQRTDQVASVWKYNSKSPVRDYRRKKSATIVVESEDEVGKE